VQPNKALEAIGARRLRNESFFSAPQLKRDSLGGAMSNPVPLILGLALVAVQADFRVSAKAKVITPDHRPAERCAVAMTASKAPPREASW